MCSKHRKAWGKLIDIYANICVYYKHNVTTNVKWINALNVNSIKIDSRKSRNLNRCISVDIEFIIKIFETHKQVSSGPDRFRNGFKGIQKGKVTSSPQLFQNIEEQGTQSKSCDYILTLLPNANKSIGRPIDMHNLMVMDIKTLNKIRTS